MPDVCCLARKVLYSMALIVYNSVFRMHFPILIRKLCVIISLSIYNVAIRCHVCLVFAVAIFK